MKNKSNGWMKGLGKNLVKGILELEPKSVKFVVERPDRISCNIRFEEGEAIGVAICSVLDQFDERSGKSRAAGRALKAAIRKEKSEFIRNTFLGFPDSWTKRQIRRVQKVSCEIDPRGVNAYKSMFVEVS